MLPTVPIPTPMTRPATQDLRVEPVVQPPRVKPSQPAPKEPLRVQHTPSTNIDPYTNPWIDLVYNRKKTTPDIQTKPKQSLPRQVQHRLRCTPLNIGTNFRAQYTQYIVAQHVFNLPYYLNIYNKKGKKKTIYTLLVGINSDTWWKSVGNELGRIANGIGNQVRATNTIHFMPIIIITTGSHSHLRKICV